MRAGKTGAVPPVTMWWMTPWRGLGTAGLGRNTFRNSLSNCCTWGGRAGTSVAISELHGAQGRMQNLLFRGNNRETEMCQEIHAKQRGSNGCNKKIEFNVKTAESPTREWSCRLPPPGAGQWVAKWTVKRRNQQKKFEIVVSILEKNQILCWKKRHCGCGRRYGGGGQQV